MFRARRCLSWVGVFLCTLTLAAAEKNFQETFNLKNGGELYVRIQSGNIEVDTWDREVVEFRAEVNGRSWFVDSFNFDYDSTPRSLEIVGEHGKKRIRWGRQSVRVRLRVPKNIQVKLSTSGGDIELADLNGDAELRSSGGDLRMANINGTLIAKTSGGNIDVGSVNGNTKISTSGGNIYLREVEGDLNAHTSGGNIELDGVTGEVLAKTSGGNIRLTVGAPFQGVRAHTSGGHIRCYVEGDLNADLLARTSGGTVNVDFPVTIRGKVAKSKIEGRINDGGAEMNLRSSGGNIKILRAR